MRKKIAQKCQVTGKKNNKAKMLCPADPVAQRQCFALSEVLSAVLWWFLGGESGVVLYPSRTVGAVAFTPTVSWGPKAITSHLLETRRAV